MRVLPHCGAACSRRVVCRLAVCAVSWLVLAGWGVACGADEPKPAAAKSVAAAPVATAPKPPTAPAPAAAREAPPHPTPAAPAKVRFDRDVLPIISAKCFHCHGPDPETREADLRLDLRDEALKDRGGYFVLMPGKPEASELVARIASDDPDMVMPPPATGHPLEPAEIDTLRRWVAEGAEYRAHWSFVRPVRPPLPHVRDPEARVAGPIDAFIVAALAPTGLRQSPRADRATLARRVALDLTGLPLEPAALEAFLADARPDAYERLVDRLLDSPAYGERWARMWLDVARYADSAGYGSDPLRLNIWPYRDWVVGAFNRNLPYDQFTIEQLAGDLLPGATLEQRVATAFHRNTMTNTEGGTDDEEFRVAAVKDRVATTIQAWMGLTMGCAQCHSHKFDPITQTEYYQTFAVFNQTADTDKADEAPRLALPLSPDGEAKRTRLQAEVTALEKRLREAAPLVEYELPELERKLRAEIDRLEQQDKLDELEKLIATPLREILELYDCERTAAERKRLLAYFEPRSQAAGPITRQLAAKRKELEDAKPVEVPVLTELPPDQRRKTHLLVKGNFLAPGEPVEPGFLKSFAPPPEGTPATRLALARWLVDRENPLTARVAVNRFWAQLFGIGLVETEEDFGTQGQPPSHPELLDWLAIDFMDRGWNVKQLLKQIVLSETYQQSSLATAEARRLDPNNRLLSHYSRRRLDAETVRDQALAISGLLSRKLGGPSVYPPQPDGLWRVAFNGQRSWTTSRGEDRYRRGLYTFWRRTIPYPSMATFDAPSRESCTLRRQPTNTPLQAFVTLNDPAFVEMAQALGRRIAAEGGSSPHERCAYGLRLALGRPASDAEVAALVALYEATRTRYLDEPEAAVKLATEPLGPLPKEAEPAEAAAWTVVGNVLLNLDGVLTKG